MAASVELQVDQVDLSISVKHVHLSLNAGSILHEERARAALRQQVSECLEWLGGAQGSARLGQNHKNIDSLKNTEKNGTGFTLEIEFLNQPEGMSSETRLTRVGGLGELCYAAVPAAFQNALSQALGIKIQKSPVEKEELFGSIAPKPHHEAQP